MISIIRILIFYFQEEQKNISTINDSFFGFKLNKGTYAILRNLHAN